MKDKIHPEYVECKVTCGCGETFATRATRAEINVEICSKCHPFYTGKQKLIDTAGRVEKFQRRYGTYAKAAGDAETQPAATEAEQPETEQAHAEQPEADTPEAEQPETKQAHAEQPEAVTPEAEQ